MDDGNRDSTVTERFNPCLYLAQFLMRNNPQFRENQEKYSNFGVMNMELKRRIMKNMKTNIMHKLKEAMGGKEEWKVDSIPEVFAKTCKLLKQNGKFENRHVPVFY